SARARIPGAAPIGKTGKHRVRRDQPSKVRRDDVLLCRKNLVGEDSQGVRTKAGRLTGDFAENGFAARRRIEFVPAFQSQLGYPDDWIEIRIAGLPQIHIARSESFDHRKPAPVAHLGPTLAEPEVLIARRKLLERLNDVADLIGNELSRRHLF